MRDRGLTARPHWPALLPPHIRPDALCRRVVSSAVVQPGETFSFGGTGRWRMLGLQVVVLVNGASNARISTTCRQPGRRVWRLRSRCRRQPPRRPPVRRSVAASPGDSILWCHRQPPRACAWSSLLLVSCSRRSRTWRCLHIDPEMMDSYLGAGYVADSAMGRPATCDAFCRVLVKCFQLLTFGPSAHVSLCVGCKI